MQIEDAPNAYQTKVVEKGTGEKFNDVFDKASQNLEEASKKQQELSRSCQVPVSSGTRNMKSHAIRNLVWWMNVTSLG